MGGIYIGARILIVTLHLRKYLCDGSQRADSQTPSAPLKILAVPRDGCTASLGPTRLRFSVRVLRI